MAAGPVLHVVVGPNGAGKSTLYDLVLEPTTQLPFVNADGTTADERAELLAERRSFVTETEFSHPSKLDLIRSAASAGYMITLHVVIVPVDLSVARVLNRVELGGHSVPESKIRERHARLWTLVREAIGLVDQAYVYDNTTARNPFRVVASFDRGRMVGNATWRAWTPEDFLT
ncbi:ATPase [Williamsia sp. Leaf354]|uniref:zeta toxin family protein n=1 Tax=Williamsia sp. Leaf354 TaxID=1736349 RepID=UPI000700A47C|nr:zeta toxin family protein [Williamsia sp. Leaf354]KQS00755.1 ATPase [Williamsia sp. Leaf354]